MSFSGREPRDAAGPVASPARAAPGRLVARLVARRAAHTLYLQPGGDIVSWCGGRTGPGPAAASISTTTGTDFEGWCDTHAGATATLYVSAHRLHSALLDPAPAARDGSALRRHAARHFAHYHGPTALEWPLAVWRDATNLLACAAPTLDLDAMRATAKRHRIDLRSVQPAWAAGLASLGRRVPAFAGPGAMALALVEGRLLTWLVVDGARLCELQHRYVDAVGATEGTDPLDGLLEALCTEGTPLVQPPLIVGWALPDPGAPPVRATLASSARWSRIGPADAAEARAAWLLDAMDAAA